MADHSVPPDHDAPGHAGAPDYALPDVLELTEPEQYRALFEETRQEIVGLLLERAATTSELADVLGKPKGTVGHHLKVLEAAGLVHVVRTKQVRAIEARYYGRTARSFMYHQVGEAAGTPQRILTTAAAEIAQAPHGVDAEGVDETLPPVMANVRHARIPVERAHEWSRRLQDLLVEFTHEPRDGDVTVAMVVAVYPTARAALPAVGDEQQPTSGEDAGERP